MQDICENKDMKFNQRKNDLKWYAETYIKTKDSLRGRWSVFKYYFEQIFIYFIYFKMFL